MVQTTTNSDGSTETSIQRFSYDADGRVLAVNYNGTYYYYLRNAQGDVVKLIDKTGSTVVEYTYDSWGKPLSTSGSLAETFGAEQPFRYRGYVYDEETGWYYLKSRYYNPELGRFISADVYLSTGQGVLGHNAYAYCLNNPVNLSDNMGQRATYIAEQNYTYVEKQSGMGGHTNAITFFSCGIIVDLGQGWKVRIENDVVKNTIGIPRKHIHIYNKQKGEEYSYNSNGSDHHDNKGGKPPKWVMKDIAEKLNWDFSSDNDEDIIDHNLDFDYNHASSILACTALICITVLCMYVGYSSTYSSGSGLVMTLN